MISNPRKKEMLLNLEVMLEHAEVLVRCVQKFPDMQKDLDQHLELLTTYKKRI